MDWYPFAVGRLEGRKAPAPFKKLFGPYAESKLALSLWTHAAAKELADDGIRLVSVCPGGNKTPMTANDGMPWWLMPIRHLFFTHPRVGARRVWEAAFGEAPPPSGSFLVKGKVTPIPFLAQAYEVLRSVRANGVSSPGPRPTAVG